MRSVLRFLKEWVFFTLAMMVGTRVFIGRFLSRQGALSQFPSFLGYLAVCAGGAFVGLLVWRVVSHFRRGNEVAEKAEKEVEIVYVKTIPEATWTFPDRSWEWIGDWLRNMTEDEAIQIARKNAATILLAMRFSSSTTGMLFQMVRPRGDL